ncbi:phospholipase-like protein [Tanacetum coccineum]
MAPEFWCQTNVTEFWCHSISGVKFSFADVTSLFEFDTTTPSAVRISSRKCGASAVVVLLGWCYGGGGAAVVVLPSWCCNGGALFLGNERFFVCGTNESTGQVREDYGLSDFSAFQNTKRGPQLFTTQASSSFFEGAQMTPRYPPSHPDTPHIETLMAQPGFASCSSRYPPSHLGTPYVGTPLALQGFAPWSSNYRPSHNRDVVGVNPAGIDLNEPLEEEVMVTGSRATDEYLSDITWTLLRLSEDDMLIFWQELVPLLCKGGYYKHQKFSEVGWLSDDQSWMELIIRARPPGARYTVAKTGMTCLHPRTQKFILETDGHIIGMLDGSSRPYPSWDDVDIVYMPLHCNGNHWVTCVINLSCSTIHVIDSLPNEDRYRSLNAHLSKWTSVLNVMLQRVGHFERTRRIPYNFKLVYNQGFCFDIPLQGNHSDCGVVTCWVI